MAAVANIHIKFGKYLYDATDVQNLYEDEQCVAFDITKNIQASVHFLVVPKKVLPRLSQTSNDDEKLLGHLLIIAKTVAIDKGLHQTGYHVVVDEDYKSQKLIAIHIFGRALHHMVWPVGPGCRL